MRSLLQVHQRLQLQLQRHVPAARLLPGRAGRAGHLGAHPRHLRHLARLAHLALVVLVVLLHMPLRLLLLLWALLVVMLVVLLTLPLQEPGLALQACLLAQPAQTSGPHQLWPGLQLASPAVMTVPAVLLPAAARCGQSALLQHQGP